MFNDKAPRYTSKSCASDVARRVLEAEGNALQVLAGSVPIDFEKLVDHIVRMPGKVVVSGMGKSGHIARKIAATLASTGTKSLFIHPAEASHGDLGMVDIHDLCLLISNSGETSELSDMIHYCLRYSIPIAGISSNESSTLISNSSFRLLIPSVAEVCPIGLAPTTTTTMALALGDALAVALMEAKGFEPTHFKVFHPGGRLGARLSTVEQLMHAESQVPLVVEEAPMVNAILSMSEKGFGIVGVIDRSHRLVGVISDGDLRRNLEGLLQKQAAEVCSSNPVTVAPSLPAAEALALMNDRKITALIVVDDGFKPTGILHIHDLLRAGLS